MRSIRNIVLVIITIIIYIFLFTNKLYAVDEPIDTTGLRRVYVYEYDNLYYITMGIGLAIVEGISLIILKKTYDINKKKNNNEDNLDENTKKSEDENI